MSTKALELGIVVAVCVVSLFFVVRYQRQQFRECMERRNDRELCAVYAARGVR